MTHDPELSELRKMCGLPDHRQSHPASLAGQRQTLSEIKRELDAESAGLLTMMRRVDAEDAHHCEWEDDAKLYRRKYTDMMHQRDEYYADASKWRQLMESRRIGRRWLRRVAFGVIGLSVGAGLVCLIAGWGR